VGAHRGAACARWTAPPVRPDVICGRDSLFYCFSAKKGGDCIQLAAHIMEVSNPDAANFLVDQFGIGNSTEHPVGDSTVSKTQATAPQKPPRRPLPVANSPQLLLVSAVSWSKPLRFKNRLK
jgi:hypothetical protein